MQELIKRIEELERRLDDLEGQELSPNQADKALSLRKGATLAAIRRGELKASTAPGSKRYRIARKDLKAWKETWQAGTGTA